METTYPAVSTYGAGSAALADLLSRPIIEQHARTDVTTYFTRDKKTSKPNIVVVLYARNYWLVST